MSRPSPQSLFSLIQTGLDKTIQRDNPWWQGEQISGLPPARRWAFKPVLENIRSGMTKATVLRGPRQVGKSTLLNHVINALLEDGVDPICILRIQFDELPQLRKLQEPVLDLVNWYEAHILGKSLNQSANDGKPVFIFLDEVQNLPDWAPQLKHLVDMNPVKVLVTGSSALRIEAGRDSLAGRITTLEMGPLLLREIAEIRGFGQLKPYLPYNGLSPMRDKQFWIGLKQFGESNRRLRDLAFAAFSERGAYPVAQARPDQPWERVSDFLVETVVKRAIQHDLRMGPRGQKRDENLLMEVFKLACRYAGQSPSQDLYLEEIRKAFDTTIGWQRVLTYLNFLDGTLLVRLIEPLELRLKKKKGASKICLCDHALRAAWLQEIIPLTPAGLAEYPYLAVLAGHIAESAAGYFFESIINLNVRHFPERSVEPEIDFILTVGEQRIPVEIKYRGRIDYTDSKGLRMFIEKPHYNAPFGIMVTLTDDSGSDDPRIVSIPLSTLLLMR